MTGAVCGICTPAVNVISSDGLVIDNALPPGSSREGRVAGVDRMSPGMSKWLNSGSQCSRGMAKGQGSSLACRLPRKAWAQ